MRFLRPSFLRRPRAVLLALLLAAFAGPAAATDPTSAIDPRSIATPAWTNVDVVLREGPGNVYDVTGEVAGESRVGVWRCHYRWCRITGPGGQGWVSIDYLSFGQLPGGPFSGPKLDYPAGGPGQVCFYTGRNFSGREVCSKSGTVVRDLVLYDLDDSFASIAVEGNVSVMVCRDFDFSSYCKRIVESQPSLKGFLDHAISSYRVY